jgi:hypothetical protein
MLLIPRAGQMFSAAMLRIGLLEFKSGPSIISRLMLRFLEGAEKQFFETKSTEGAFEKQFPNSRQLQRVKQVPVERKGHMAASRKAP